MLDSGITRRRSIFQLQAVQSFVFIATSRYFRFCWKWLKLYLQCFYDLGQHYTHELLYWSKFSQHLELTRKRNAGFINNNFKISNKSNKMCGKNSLESELWFEHKLCIQILIIWAIKIHTKAFTEKLNESRSEIESSLQMWLPKEKWPELERVLINILSE